MGVSMDGGMIHIRDEGWKELKVGSVFDVEVRPTRDQGTDYGVTLAHAVRNSYVAHLGGPKIFGQFEGHATCIALELEVAAWHYPSIARALRKEAGQFRVQVYFAVTHSSSFESISPH
jgi:hypothetical protein